MPVARPPGVQCPKWEPASTGSKRCRYYIDPDPAELQREGLCRLPDELLCVEWVRRWGSAEQRTALALRKLIAPPTQPMAGQAPQEPAGPAPLALAAGAAAPPAATAPPGSPPMPIAGPLGPRQRVFEPARQLDPMGLAALEQAAAEVELVAPHLPSGSVTLVAARTGRTDRVEITYREVAVLTMLVNYFPGAHVTGYRPGSAQNGSDRAAPEYPPSGTLCSDCGQAQYRTPGGLSCPNGHGGAEPAPADDDPLS
jgi:hypothetical protein